MTGGSFSGSPFLPLLLLLSVFAPSVLSVRQYSEHVDRRLPEAFAEDDYDWSIGLGLDCLLFWKIREQDNEIDFAVQAPIEHGWIGAFGLCVGGGGVKNMESDVCGLSLSLSLSLY